MVSLSQDPACSAVELAKSQAPAARSMRTLRSKFVLHADLPPSDVFSLADSGDIDLTLLVSSPSSFRDAHDFLDLSQAFSDFSACSSDISGELQRLASIPPGSDEADRESAASPEELELGLGFAEQQPEDEEEEILGFLESMDAEELEPTIRIFISALGSPSASAKRSAAGKIRLLAKNREQNRELIGRTGAIPPLIGLLRCRDPVTQEYAATALLNLSLYDANRAAIAAAGGIKPLVYALKTGTAVAKENSACALSSLAMVEENKSSIGAAGAVPALVALLIGGSARGKKDALTALYKLSSLRRASCHRRSREAPPGSDQRPRLWRSGEGGGGAKQPGDTGGGEGRDRGGGWDPRPGGGDRGWNSERKGIRCGYTSGSVRR